MEGGTGGGHLYRLVSRVRFGGELTQQRGELGHVERAVAVGVRSHKYLAHLRRDQHEMPPRSARDRAEMRP